jgi:phenylacetaldehyde dehydrogenase
MVGCLLNQGQVCAAASRLYIHRSIFDKVVSGIQSAMKSLKLGPGLDPTATMQPLVSKRYRDSVEARVEKARSMGASIVTGGSRAQRDGFFYEPTLIVGVNQQNSALQDEIFGPVVAAVPVDNIEQALKMANDSSYGLTASIWSNDINHVMKAVRHLKAGTVWVNSHVPVDPNLPFGGFKQSGMGREHGRAAIDLYTEVKSVCIATPK